MRNPQSGLKGSEFHFEDKLDQNIKAGPIEMKYQLDQEGGHRHFLCLGNINYKLMWRLIGGFSV